MWRAATLAVMVAGSAGAQEFTRESAPGHWLVYLGPCTEAVDVLKRYRDGYAPTVLQDPLFFAESLALESYIGGAATGVLKDEAFDYRAGFVWEVLQIGCTAHPDAAVSTILDRYLNAD